MDDQFQFKMFPNFGYEVVRPTYVPSLAPEDEWFPKWCIIIDDEYDDTND